MNVLPLSTRTFSKLTGCPISRQVAPAPSAWLLPEWRELFREEGDGHSLAERAVHLRANDSFSFTVRPDMLERVMLCICKVATQDALLTMKPEAGHATGSLGSVEPAHTRHPSAAPWSVASVGGALSPEHCPCPDGHPQG